MKVTFKDHVLTINSGIPVKTLKQHSHISLSDEGEELFAVAFKERPAGSIDMYSLVTNSADAEGIAQAVIVVPTEVTLDDIKKAYGEELVQAAEYLPKIVEQAAQSEAAINRIFNSIEA